MATGVVANTNVSSLQASRILARNRQGLEKAMERLSSGKRINTAADDATGMAVAAKIRADVRSLDQAVRNANDGISFINTYDGAASEIEGILVRMRELATQAQSGTYTTNDLAHADAEFVQLAAEITRISDNTQWNGMSVLASATTYTFQVGSGSTSTSSVDVTFQDMDATTLGVGSLAVSSNTAAQSAISSIDAAITTVDTFRATLGAKINRMESAATNLANVSMNTAASRSRIEDADYAQATTELARTQIIQQAATAMLAQANQQPQSVLSLLK